MMMTACSKEEVKTDGGKKGMTMTAAVQEDSKATLDQDGTKYHFNWETNDKVYVYNPSSTEYMFINNGTSFVNEEAMPAAGNWVATYPKTRTESLYFAGQDGTLKTVADKYLLYGSTTASAGQTKLEFAMQPACAVLKITTTEPLSSVILAVDSDNPYLYYISNVAKYIKPYNNGYVIDRDELGNKYSGLFWAWEDEPETILPAGTYYFIVPSNEELYLWINETQMNTGAKTFTAGTVYTLNYPNN